MEKSNKPGSAVPLQDGKKNENLKRKPSFKKPPEVKQTLTSYNRMLKNNPLLKYQMQGVVIDQMFLTKSGSSALIGQNKPEINKSEKKPLQRTQSLKLPKALLPKRPSTIISGNKPNSQKMPVGSFNMSKQSNCEFATSSHSRFLSSTRLDSNSSDKVLSRMHQSGQSQEVSSSTESLLTVPQPQVPASGLLRKSISAQHLTRRKDEKSDTVVPVATSKLAGSMEEIQPVCSPILEEKSNCTNSFVFKTPSAYNRRSISQSTPRSVNGRSQLRTSTPALPVKDLQERLAEWLSRRGKSVSLYHHLKCFGIHPQKPKNIKEDQVEHEENKENIETEILAKGSYEDLRITETTPKEEASSEATLNEENLEVIAKGALVDLLKLIQEGYPRQQCDGWLDLIRQKYKNLEEEPEYWECRAAIEQAAGNIGNAVEFYKTAIVQGAEIHTVDKSLDHLLHKFSLLNINQNHNNETSDRERERIVRDARNVFKSSIIKFAVQERKLKKKGDEQKDGVKLVATPVRRSTRLSRSGYTTTPGVKLCSSIKELNASGEVVDFQKNKALC